jgi:hypothetical protein
MCPTGVRRTGREKIKESEKWRESCFCCRDAPQLLFVCSSPGSSQQPSPPLCSCNLSCSFPATRTSAGLTIERHSAPSPGRHSSIRYSRCMQTPRTCNMGSNDVKVRGKIRRLPFTRQSSLQLRPIRPTRRIEPRRDHTTIGVVVCRFQGAMRTLTPPLWEYLIRMICESHETYKQPVSTMPDSVACVNSGWFSYCCHRVFWNRQILS